MLCVHQLNATAIPAIALLVAKGQNNSTAMAAIALLVAKGQNSTATFANCNSCCKGKEKRESCRHACSLQKAECCRGELGSSCTMHRAGSAACSTAAP